MNKYSPKIDEVRAHVLDTESLLHFLCNRENLKAVLAHGSPEVPIGGHA